MEVVIKLLEILGTVILVVGLLWSLFGLINFFQARKNRNKPEMDEGLESMLYGALIGVAAKGVIKGIVAYLSSINF